MISHTVSWSNPELRRDNGWPMMMITITDEMALHMDVHMCEEMSSCIIDAVPFK